MVHITEAVGDNIAAGQQSIDVTCTGASQTITLDVTPAEHPFKKGVAWGSAELQVYSPNDALAARDSHTVQLTN